MDHPEDSRWKRVSRHPLAALVVAAALVVLVSLLLSWLFGYVPQAIRDSWGGMLPTLVNVAVLFALYKLVLRKLGDRPHDDLPREGAGTGLALGAAGGFLLIGLTVALAALAGVYHVVRWEAGGDFLRIVFRFGIGAAFLEELLMRGVLFRWLEEFGGSWAALALTSLLFGLLHAANLGATVFSTIAIMFGAGILLGAAYMYARSLWLPMGIHFGWNVSQGCVFDVPVSGNDVDGLVQARLSGSEWLSGGPFGLEASVIALVVATIAGVWLLLRAVRKGRVIQPRWRRLARAG